MIIMIVCISSGAKKLGTLQGQILSRHASASTTGTSLHHLQQDPRKPQAEG